MKQIIVVGVTLVIAAAGLSACAGNGPGPMASALPLPPDKFHGVMKPCNPASLYDKRVCFDVVHD
jgi:hypothetical protein